MTLPSVNSRFIIPDLPTTDALIPYLRQIDENRWYSNFGPLAQAFEKRFAATMAGVHGCGAEEFIPTGVGTGYQALTVGLRLSGLEHGDKVLVPAVTFPACPLAVSHLGGEPVLCDVDPATWTLTPAIARAAAQKMKLAAVMPVCVYGFPLPAEEWDAFTLETGVKVVIDAAAAVESQRYLKHGFVAHSLHALKPFGIGEGGILVTADPDQAQAIRQSINFGMTDRITYQSGENAKMSEYHAAVALAQLDRWEEIKARRRAGLAKYKVALGGRVDVNLLHDQTIPSSLMIKIKQPRAKTLFAALTKAGIAAHRTYLPPLFDHPHFASLTVLNAMGQVIGGAARHDMAGAALMNDHVLGLPFHAFLSDDEIHHTATLLYDSMGQLS